MTTPVITFPEPADTVLIGFMDSNRTRICALRRAAVTGLQPQDYTLSTPNEDGSWSAVDHYNVLAVGDNQTVLVASLGSVEERRAWLRNNAAAWLA